MIAGTIWISRVYISSTWGKNIDKTRIANPTIDRTVKTKNTAEKYLLVKEFDLTAVIIPIINITTIAIDNSVITKTSRATKIPFQIQLFDIAILISKLSNA